MKFLIVFALAFATASAKDLYSRSIEVPVLENEARITNGKKAAKGQFYYQVGLSFVKGRDSWMFCGGSVIGNNWILTAAHCADFSPSVRVYMGSNIRLAAAKFYNVFKKDIIMHPRWDSNTVKNDISLVMIPTTNETNGIGIVKIPSNNDDDYVGDIVFLSGWGQTSDDSKALSNYLQYAILKVSPGSVCAGSYELFYNIQTNLCVATPDYVSPCFGDSGAPLVLYKQNLQVGLFSYGSIHGCEVGRPSVFTRVSAYILWIEYETKIDY